VSGVTIDELLARDEPVCIWCGRAPWRRDLTAEHLLPRSRGGRGNPENLALACRACNRRRRSRGIVAYVRAQRDAGLKPRADLIERALQRLSTSAVRAQAEYGARQLDLLDSLDVKPPHAA
jgi:5-methylcytosine-specific restriction endonuclease McrA